MRSTRREFIRIAGVAGAASVIPWQRAMAFYPSPGIPLFGTVLRGVGPGGIPVAAPDGFAAPVTGVQHYTIDIKNYADSGVCPTLGATGLWGYHPAKPLGGGVQPPRALGGIIVAQRGTPIQITFRNKLNVTKHFLPLDQTLMGAEGAVDRVSVHLHGGFTPWISDGGPLAWFDPRGIHGSSFMNNAVLNPHAACDEAEYYYPNDQSARMMWYHDHALGNTRLNAYAGMATAYLLRDAFEISLKNFGLPEFVENSVLGGTPVVELPLVVTDKVFVGHDIDTVDPTWRTDLGLDTTPGSLWYAHQYDADIEGGTPPDLSCVPEFFGDTMLVNGTVYPRVPVEPRRYRLRILNACNARFLNLQLYLDDGSPNGITLDAAGRPTNKPFVDGAQLRPAVLQIGTEGGFLPKPVLVPMNVPFDGTAVTASLPRVPKGRKWRILRRFVCDPRKLKTSLVMGPAERADLLIDFGLCRGKKVVLYNDAPSPFPMGGPDTDYFPGLNVADNPVNGHTPAGHGPNTRVLMRFEVGGAASHPDMPLRITTHTGFLNGIDPLIVPQGVIVPPPGVRRRKLTLNESFDGYGRLIQMLGVFNPAGGNGGLPYDPDMAPPTETPTAGSTEVWEIFNLTGDVHPMHFHLVNVQVLNRQAFLDPTYDGSGAFTGFDGAPYAPELNETGWKETVRMYPGTVTRIIMKFDLPKITKAPSKGPKGHAGTVDIPPSPLGGAEYVWHCHILEHEEHDMMRPLIVT